MKDKILFLTKELIKMYSNFPSFFSKKRIESGVAFAIGQAGMITYFILHVASMTSTDLAAWSCIEFALAGYIIKEIQKEKK